MYASRQIPAPCYSENSGEVQGNVQNQPLDALQWNLLPARLHKFYQFFLALKIGCGYLVVDVGPEVFNRREVGGIGGPVLGRNKMRQFATTPRLRGSRGVTRRSILLKPILPGQHLLQLRLDLLEQIDISIGIESARDADQGRLSGKGDGTPKHDARWELALAVDMPDARFVPYDIIVEVEGGLSGEELLIRNPTLAPVERRTVLCGKQSSLSSMSFRQLGHANQMAGSQLLAVENTEHCGVCNAILGSQGPRRPAALPFGGNDQLFLRLVIQLVWPSTSRCIVKADFGDPRFAPARHQRGIESGGALNLAHGHVGVVGQGKDDHSLVSLRELHTRRAVAEHAVRRALKLTIGAKLSCHVILSSHHHHI